MGFVQGIIVLVSVWFIYSGWSTSQEIKKMYQEYSTEILEVFDLIKKYMTFTKEVYFVIGHIEATDLFQWGPYPSERAAEHALEFIANNMESIIGYNATTKTIDDIPVFKKDMEFRIDNYPLGGK